MPPPELLHRGGRAAAVVLALAASVGAFAQAPRFAQAGEALPQEGARIVGAADYEGDGDDDLFCARGVMLNDGSGTFRLGPTFPTDLGDFASYSFQFPRVVIADVNGDGWKDLLFGNDHPFEIGLRLFRAPAGGSGAFVDDAAAFAQVPSASHLNDPSHPRRLAPGDVDGDGDVDLLISAVVAGAPTLWSLVLNDGSGAFSPAPSTMWSTSNLTGFAAQGFGDLDGDGDLDAYRKAANGEWWRNNVGGVFGGLQLLPGFGTNPGEAVVLDWNGDGADDIVSGQQNIIVRLGGVGGPAGASFFVAPAAYPSGLTVRDVDGDGIDDLIRSEYAANGGVYLPDSVPLKLAVYFGGALPPGPPTVLDRVLRSAVGGGSAPGFAFGDFEGDGDTDLAVLGHGGWPSVHLGDGAGGLTRVERFLPHGAEAPALPPFDLDGDGDVDLIARSWDPAGVGTWSLRRLENDGRGRFASAPVGGAALDTAYGPDVEGRAGMVAAWGDFDLDGDPDLYGPLAALGSSGGLAGSVFTNDGVGGFTATAVSSAVVNKTVVADFDGDGDPDVVEARPSDGSTRGAWLVRNIGVPGGPITFATAQFFGPNFDATDVAAFDAEGDGDVDLLFGAQPTNTTSGNVRLFYNNGAGVFTATSVFSGIAARFVAVGDLDADGDVDCVMDGVTRLRTGGTYVAGPALASVEDFFALPDVDGDGDADLVDALGSWRANAGGGAFGATTQVFAMEPVSFIAFAHVPPFLADFDRDGDVDVLTPGRRAPFTMCWNTTRHAAPGSLLRLGEPAAMEVYGAPGEPYLMAVAAAFAPTPAALPTFGLLHLDVATAIPFAFDTVPAGGRATIPGFVPAGPPSLVGLELVWQAAVGVRLTNAFATTVLP